METALHDSQTVAKIIDVIIVYHLFSSRQLKFNLNRDEKSPLNDNDLLIDTIVVYSKGKNLYSY